MDYQKTINVRSEYIGGIDNEYLDFEQLDQFTSVAATVGNLDEANGTNNSSHNAASDTEREAPATPPSAPNGAHISTTTPTIATISARVSLSSTPIATPLPAAVSGSSPLTAVVSHLPESPPDSGSEPPYSPLQDVHGLTLTSREFYNGLSSLQPPLQLQTHHYTPTAHQQSQQSQQPHQPHQQPSQPQPHAFPHNLQNHLSIPLGAGIRVKHETGLIVNTGALKPPTQQPQIPHELPNLQQQHHHLQQQPQQQHLLYTPHSNSANNSSTLLPHYSGGDISSVYPAVSYPDITVLGDGSEQATPCMLSTSVNDGARVQVIGTTSTSQASHSQLGRISAPSTPVLLPTSRKRKLSTQLDCKEYAQIKPDPGLIMSPVGGSNLSSHLAPLHIDTQKLDPSSPPQLQNTPAHSTASLSPALSTVNSSHADNSLDGNANNANGSGGSSHSGNGSVGADSSGDANAPTPSIRFSPFQMHNWHKLYDQGQQEIAVDYYHVVADKGFNFSVSDDAFVCQKKNHFQITCQAHLQRDATFVKTPSGLQKIISFHLHFYGVKLEAPDQTIRVEQSQSDRSKKPFYPVPIDLQSHTVSKVTVGRLHFSETTNNNMRKKGRPNPEQRYFQLVVGLHVHTMSGNFPLISQGSERIIVRASNPGQFESDVDLCWQRGLTQDSIYHAGRVGINTDRPDESLVVHGNLKISGHIVQPSDSRAKQEIAELDTSVQLRNLQKIRIVRYRYEPEFAIHSGLKRASASDSEEIIDTGVIAQEVREVIPDAVQEAGSIVLPNGNVIENFLTVNKDRILMENIGAVKELCKVTGSLQTRIEDLERLNSHLVYARDFDQTTHPNRMGKSSTSKDGYAACSNRALQAIILILIVVMAVCFAAVCTLYFVEHNRQPNRNHPDPSFMDLLQHSIVNKTHNQWPNFLMLNTTPRPHGRNYSKALRPETGASGHRENYGSSHVAARERSDEPLVMEKSFLHKITTTAPLLRNNKTNSSKNKLKWPLGAEGPASDCNKMAVNMTAAAQPRLRSNTLAMSAIADQQQNSVAAGTVDVPLTPSPSASNVVEAPPSVRVRETSSEKVGDAIPSPQDFENNSIDIDAQHVAKKAAPASPVSNNKPVEQIDNIASTSSSNSIINIQDTTASDRHLRRSNGEGVISNVFKTVSPPVNAAGINNYSIEASAISNKSQGVLESNDPHTVDGSDLQNLNGNNESADNPITALPSVEFFGSAPRESSLGRRSTSQRSVEWMTRKVVHVEMLGAPPQCKPQQQLKGSTDEQVSNCQSLCFEDSNQLPLLRPLSLTAPQVAQKEVNEQLQQNVDPDDVETEDADEDVELDEIHTPNVLRQLLSAVTGTGTGTAGIAPSINTNLTVSSTSGGKTSHSTSSKAKQFSAEQQHADAVEETVETDLEPANSEERIDLPFDKNAPLTPNLSIEVQRPPPSDCWKIASSLLAPEGLNNTFGMEDFCPSTGKMLNITYVIPLSKYFKEQTLELHLSSSVPLLWTICGNHEHVKENGKYLVHIPAHQLQQPVAQSQQQHEQPHKKQQQQPYGANQLQRRENNSILFLNLPSRGYFLRDLAVRATNNFEKSNICDEVFTSGAHEPHTILQYNFRILRDCD